ncbi:MAG: hypothetical protein JWQ71_3378 [Pedosphaera sp.]|nr:hypothetical protein [Pedosphaera sp.]
MNLTPSTGSKLGDKMGMGCLALFALPFAGIGIFTAYKAIESFLQGKIKDGLFFVLFAVMFGGVGFALLIGIFRGSKSQKRTNALQLAHPDEPWLWREDWASGRIASSNKTTMLFAWGFAAFWNIVSSSVFFAIPKEITKGNYVMLLALLFPLVGIGLLTWAIRTTIRWKKFGQSWFKLLNNPGAIGGQLTGAIETSVKLHPKAGFKLHLRCIHRDSSGENTTEHILWEDEKTIVKDLLDAPQRSGIPVFFQIPADCSPTDETISNHKTIWRLEVRAKVDGRDYFAQFEVPVFKTASTASISVVDPTLSFQAPTEPYQRPANSRIQIHTLPNGGTEFYFPAGRNIGPAIFLFCFLAIWNASIWFMMTLHAPILFPIVFGIFDLILLLVFAGMLFKSSRITLDTLGLHAQQNWTLFNTNRRFAPDNIKFITIKIGMTSSQITYYDLQLITRQNPNPRFANAAKQKNNPEWGCTFTLASSIRDKKEAEWLAAEMLRLLKLDNSRANGQGIEVG